MIRLADRLVSQAPQLRRTPWLRALGLAFSASLPVSAMAARAEADSTPPPAPMAVLGRTPEESSTPEWPSLTQAPKGAPNVLVVMTDDVGFGSSSTFGGAIPTPTFDALAKQGLRYNNFNTTAICSPTRASLLTGRNPQAVGMGYTTNWPTAYPGYTGVIPKSVATVSQILGANGYSTAMLGKGHITPEWEMGLLGPFDRWPTGLGFQYFYGFLGADTSQFQPTLIENTRPVPMPNGYPAGYHLDRDLADHAIRWLREQKSSAPGRPFFMYYAPGTAHAPNHAPEDWRARFKGRFDQGWDALRAETIDRQKAAGVVPAQIVDTPRPQTLPRWAELSKDQQRLYARYMEAYAASLAYSDFQIGRVIDELRRTGQLDNTLVIYIQGDNGASAEGSFDGKLYEQSALAGVKESQERNLSLIDHIGDETTYSLIPGGWAWAMNAPFSWAKRYASHFGGTRNGMVMTWGQGIKAHGELRQQFHHVSDIMPTILEVAGVQAPESYAGVPQQPVTGVSMRYSFDAPQQASRRSTQVAAMAQNLSIYHDGWVAATQPFVTPWERERPTPVAVQDRVWELYHVDEDFNESRDLAQAQPAKLEQLKTLFWIEAARNQILPIHSSEGRQTGMPHVTADIGKVLEFDGGLSQLSENAAPQIVGKSFSITARIVVPEGGAKGVVVAHGGRFGGYSLFLDHSKPVFTYRLTPEFVHRAESSQALTPGPHEIVMNLRLQEGKPAAPAEIVVSADGKAVARATVPRSFPLVVSHSEGFDVGHDLVTAVDDVYRAEDSALTATLEKLRFTFR